MENIKIILKSSPLFPKQLLTLKQPPEFIFAVGNMKLLNAFSVGVVGARACTEESIFLTKQLVNELSRRGIIIISGMADGIDSVAHEACLECKGKTIAIIGAGFDIVHGNPMFKKILENNGLILSEYFPDIPAYRYNFPRRNELLVALSNAIVAVETHIGSGTMITAQNALKQKIPLFTFPGGIHDPHFLGNNKLLMQGAICINSYSDVLKYLRKKYPQKRFNASPNKSQYLPIPDEFQDIYSVLEEAPQSINYIAQKLNMPLSVVQSKLTMMELNDLVYRMSNNCFCKKNL